MMVIFEPGSYGEFVDHKGTDDCHFDFGKDLVVVNSPTEVGVDPVEKQVFFVNRPVWISVCECGINFRKFRIIFAGTIKRSESLSKIMYASLDGELPF